MDQNLTLNNNHLVPSTPVKGTKTNMDYLAQVMLQTGNTVTGAAAQIMADNLRKADLAKQYGLPSV